MKMHNGLEFSYGTACQGSGGVAAAAWVAAVAWLQSLAGEIPHAVGAAKKKHMVVTFMCQLGQAIVSICEANISLDVA